MERINDERAGELAGLLGRNQLPWRYDSRTMDFDGNLIPQFERDRDELTVAAVNSLPDLLADRADLKAQVKRLEWKIAEVRKVCEGYRGFPVADAILAALDSEPE